MSVTIISDAPDGTHYRITLEKTASDKGVITVAQWQKGRDPQSPPSKSDVQNLYKIKAKSDGSALVCKADVFPFYPDVTFTIHDAEPPAKPDIKLHVSIPGHDADYIVSPADEAKIKQFITSSAFPILP